LFNNSQVCGLIGVEHCRVFKSLSAISRWTSFSERTSSNDIRLLEIFSAAKGISHPKKLFQFSKTLKTGALRGTPGKNFGRIIFRQNDSK
jgi:hypothetical protein